MFNSGLKKANTELRAQLQQADADGRQLAAQIAEEGKAPAVEAASTPEANRVTMQRIVDGLRLMPAVRQGCPVPADARAGRCDP
jgi:hypothetical protein